jgi:hypothetical protein
MVSESTPWAIDPELFPAEITMEDPATEAMRDAQIVTIRNALGDLAFGTLCRRIKRLRNGRFDLQVLDKTLTVICQDSIDRVELQKLAQQKRFAELAGQCRDRLGRERFNTLIKRMLKANDVPDTHRDIVRTPYSCVVTTNFDNLLEEAYARYSGFGIPRAPTGAELVQQGTLLLDRSFFILKAHGDAARPETMVFTADDYRRVIHANPAFQAVLGGILLTHAVLFVGYSLSDTNFRLLLDNHLTIFNGNVPPRYAILSGVGAAERDILWKTAKLQVLPYPEGQHQEVGRCLAALADESSNAVSGGLRRIAPAKTNDSVSGVPCTTLVLDINGDRLTAELVRQHAIEGADRVFFGGGPSPDARLLGTWLRRADGAQGRGQSPKGDVKRVGAALANTLLAGLRRKLRLLPRSETIELVCSPDAMRIPWEWTLIGGEPLSLRQPIVRRPVEITHKARGFRYVKRPLRALVFGDAGTGDGLGNLPLHYADLEAKTIDYLLRTSEHATSVTRLSRRNATHARVLAELDAGDYDLLHFGGHAWFDAHEAFFCLWDRIMLGSELAPMLSRRPPALMVLNTHYTAFVLAEVDATLQELVGAPLTSYTVAPRGDPRGFAEAAMRCGVSSFVGAFGSVGDLAAAEFSVAFYAHLLTGMTVAEATSAARRKTARITLDSGLFYTVFGYAAFRLTEQPYHGQGRGSVAKSVADAKARAKWSAPPPRR